MQNTENPYVAPSADMSVNKAQVAVPYFKAWIIFFLISAVAGGLLGGVLGVAIGFGLGSSGVAMKTIPIITGLIGFAVGIPISFFTFKWCVKRFIVER